MEIWQWIQKIAFATLGWSLGFYLGIRQKRPAVVIDCIKVSEDETYLQLNNVGEKSALNVQIEKVVFRFKLKPDDPFYESSINGSFLEFKFDKIGYIEASKPQKTLVRVYLRGEEKEIESARKLYSPSLQKVKFLKVTYTDNFGIRYVNKLKDLRVI